VGNNGETLVADSSTSTGLRYTGNYAAGKNAIINGDFRINQRGFTSVTTNAIYTFDRFVTRIAGDGTATFTPQTFTPGTAPVAGYEAINFLRIVTASQSNTSVITSIRQPIEDVRTFAGQTVTISFWAKAASGTPNVLVEASQVFNSSPEVTTLSSPIPITTSWARYSATLNIPSISGKTIAAGNNLKTGICVSAGSTFPQNPVGIQNNTFDIWGFQVEAGSVATAFQTATGTIQGELSAAQRYYYRVTPGAIYTSFGNGFSNSATVFLINTPFPVTMRIAPTALEQSGTAAQYGVFQGSGGFTNSAVPSFYHSTNSSVVTNFTVASGLTTGQGGFGRTDNSTSGYLGWSAEL
jgi:hypothetical protein